MTQDQYGQVRGDVADDETDDYPSGQSKPMTRFQKVASALRGDHPEGTEGPDDSGETDEDQVPGGQLDPNYSTAAGSGPDAYPGADTDQGTYPGTVTDPSEVTDPNERTSPGHGGVSDATANPDTTTAIRQGEPGSAGQSVWDARSDQSDTATGAQRGDYWEVPDPREDQVAAATYPETPVDETGTNPLPNQDETRPDIPEAQEASGAYAPDGTAAGTAAEDTTAADTDHADTVAADTGHADTVAAHTVRADDGAGTTVAGDTAADGVPADGVPADAVVGDRPGAATVADAPVAQQDTVAQDAGVTGRHAADAPAEQDKRPGEAAGTLGDLDDLAYGNLIPDAAHYTEQWQQIQFRFVDDPQASVTEAAEVIAQVTAKLEAAIAERQRAIQARQDAIAERQRSLRDRWGEGSQADTETLRETLRMYRAFLDQLIGPKA
jgi:hypothetical protein